MGLSQEEVDMLYEKEFVTVKNAALLLGISRQRIAILIKNKTFTVYDTRNKNYIQTKELLSFSLKKRRKLLAQVNNILLPTIT